MSKFEYNFNIVIEGTGLPATRAEDYVTNTRQVLQRIFGVETGKVLLNAMKKSGYWTYIKPYDGRLGPCNARFASGKTGEHKWSDVFFTPNSTSASPCAAALNNEKFNRGKLDHELLHHELVHSLRHLAAHYHTGGPVLGNDGMLLYGAKDTHIASANEELYAILITNIFVTDPSNKLEKSGLRANWKTYEPLHRDYSDSFGFFQSGPTMHANVQMLCNDLKDYCSALAAIPATFNPIAAFKKDPKKTQELSQSPEAQVAAAFDAFGNMAIELPKQIRQLENNLNYLEQKLAPKPAKP